MAKGQVAVLGLGRFGQRVARELQKKGVDVLAIDSDENRVREVSLMHQHVMQADVSDRATLIELGVPESDSVIVAVGGDIQVSLMTTVQLHNLGTRYIVARARDELHGEALERLGAHKVVYPEHDTAENLARTLLFRGVDEYLDLDRDYGISKVIVNEQMAGKTLEDLGLIRPGQPNELSVLLVIRNGHQAILQPDRLEKVSEKDTIVLAGLDKSFEELHLERFAPPPEDKDQEEKKKGR